MGPRLRIREDDLSAGGLREDRRDAGLAPGGPEQRAGLALFLHVLEGPTEGLDLVRLLDEIDRASLHRLDRRVDRPLAGDHNDGGVGAHDPKTMEDLESRGLGHAEVEESRIKGFPLDDPEGLAAIRGGDHFVLVLSQEPGQLFPERV